MATGWNYPSQMNSTKPARHLEVGYGRRHELSAPLIGQFLGFPPLMFSVKPVDEIIHHVRLNILLGNTTLGTWAFL